MCKPLVGHTTDLYEALNGFGSPATLFRMWMRNWLGGMTSGSLLLSFLLGREALFKAFVNLAQTVRNHDQQEHYYQQK